MIGRKKNIQVASAVLLGALMALAPDPANAQNIFDLLFGGGIRHQRRDFPEPPPRTAPSPRPAPIKKIAAPSYYTYKADPLVRVDFRPLIEMPMPASMEPSLSGGGFREALAWLADFELSAEKEFGPALVEYYSKHPQFIWVSGLSANAKAGAAIRVLSEAAKYGLDPADYVVGAPTPAFSMDDMAARYAALIRFEMTLSARVLRYARDAWSGRIDPNRLSGYHDFPRKPLDLTKVLQRLAHTQDPRAYLASRHPQNDEYQALLVELEAQRASAENEIVVDPGLMLRPGGSSAELPKILTLIEQKSTDAFRAEHGAALARFRMSETYDNELVPLVRAAQQAHGLNPDGIIGPRTVAALAGVSRAGRIAKVKIALEQLRWHPSDLGSPRVFINQPAFSAYFIESGEEKLSMRTIIGKVTNQTSFFHDEIEQVDYNPYWGVPQSIIVNEMLPRLRQDPGYLDRAGYEVTDARGRRIPSSSIDWGRYNGKVPYSVRQTPSEANALGELKILFPNKHAIYMHDTPQRTCLTGTCEPSATDASGCRIPAAWLRPSLGRLVSTWRRKSAAAIPPKRCRGKSRSTSPISPHGRGPMGRSNISPTYTAATNVSKRRSRRYRTNARRRPDRSVGHGRGAAEAGLLRVGASRSARSRAGARRCRAGAAGRSSGSGPRSSPSTARSSRRCGRARTAR
jgi:L,D-transpeptidase YcbB